MTKTALVIGAVWPESKSSAAGQNMTALLNHFIEHQYTVHFASAATDSIHADSRHYHIHQIALNDSGFDELIRRLKPDIVVFDRFMTEEQFASRVRNNWPDALHILNTEDLHSLRHARHEAIKQGLPATDATLNNVFSQREIAAILRSDISLIISPAEYALLTGFYQVPAKQLQLMPLQQPLSEGQATPTFDQRQHFMTVGNFRHAPNWDAVLQLKQIWPAIRQQLPEVQLHIYGAYPPKKATQLHNVKQGFIVKGWVDDVNAVMRHSRVCLAPLRFGAGVKGKLLTAMLHGTPSVTTLIGAEGIASPEAWPGAVVNEIPADTDDFVRHAIRLYRHEADWSCASARTTDIVNQYRSEQANAVVALFTKVNAIRRDIHGYRQSLFLQSLVWHHSLRASQYMTQWIEAKNRN